MQIEFTKSTRSAANCWCQNVALARRSHKQRLFLEENRVSHQIRRLLLAIPCVAARSFGNQGIGTSPTPPPDVRELRPQLNKSNLAGITVSIGVVVDAGVTATATEGSGVKGRSLANVGCDLKTY